MELFKYIDEHRIEKFEGDFIVVNERIKTNPTEQDIRAIGYKDLIEEDAPEYDEEKQYLETYYEDGEVITKKYKVIDIPEDAPEEVFEDELPTE